jgi:hypothetical protein
MEGVWESLGVDTRNSVRQALSEWLNIAEIFGRRGTEQGEEVEAALAELGRG